MSLYKSLLYQLLAFSAVTEIDRFIQCDIIIIKWSCRFCPTGRSATTGIYKKRQDSYENGWVKWDGPASHQLNLTQLNSFYSQTQLNFTTSSPTHNFNSQHHNSTTPPQLTHPPTWLSDSIRELLNKCMFDNNHQLLGMTLFQSLQTTKRLQVQLVFLTFRNISC